jgi:hypothetical protein
VKLFQQGQTHRESPALSANRNPDDAGRLRPNKNTTFVRNYLTGLTGFTRLFRFLPTGWKILNPEHPVILSKKNILSTLTK